MQARSGSPTRAKQLSDEEKLAFFLNNITHMDRSMRPPPLANEIIMTHKEEIKHYEIEEAPKRLKMKDAGVQKSEEKTKHSMKEVQTDDDQPLGKSRGYKSTDISTTTEPTPLKSRPVQEPPPTIKEEALQKPKKNKKLPTKKKPKPVVQEDYNIHEIVIDPDEEILLEGEMVKFKPGIEKNFISRWI